MTDMRRYGRERSHKREQLSTRYYSIRKGPLLLSLFRQSVLESRHLQSCPGKVRSFVSTATISQSLFRAPGLVWNMSKVMEQHTHSISRASSFLVYTTKAKCPANCPIIAIFPLFGEAKAHVPFSLTIAFLKQRAFFHTLGTRLEIFSFGTRAM